jgi:hypothetical protein
LTCSRKALASLFMNAPPGKDGNPCHGNTSSVTGFLYHFLNPYHKNNRVNDKGEEIQG